METLKRFVSQFAPMEISNVHKMGRRYYQISEKLLHMKNSIDRDTYGVGVFLGEEKKQFNPSFALLDMIGKKTKKITKINDKGEWLFVCKRDVFEDNIIKSSERGICIVQNELGETLGYGRISKKKNKLNLEPIKDRGDFLRRE